MCGPDYYETPAPTPEVAVAEPVTPKVKTPRKPGLKSVKRKLAEQKAVVEELERQLAELREADRKRPRKKKTSSIREETPASARFGYNPQPVRLAC